jgi:hypothetical protein
MFAFVCTRARSNQKTTATKRGYLVGLPGFEPGTSCTPSRRASQAAPQPDDLILTDDPFYRTLPSRPTRTLCYT